ncbi:hypothetical protein DF186_22635, partial [Enterococcus hirae]
EAVVLDTAHLRRDGGKQRRPPMPETIAEITGEQHGRQCVCLHVIHEKSGIEAIHGLLGAPPVLVQDPGRVDQPVDLLQSG